MIETVVEFFRIAALSCATIADAEKSRLMLGETATKFAYAVHDPTNLTQLPPILAELCEGDPELVPALSRATAIISAAARGH